MFFLISAIEAIDARNTWMGDFLIEWRVRRVDKVNVCSLDNQMLGQIDLLQGTYSMRVNTWSSRLLPEFPVREPFREQRFLLSLWMGWKQKKTIW